MKHQIDHGGLDLSIGTVVARGFDAATAGDVELALVTALRDALSKPDLQLALRDGGSMLELDRLHIGVSSEDPVEIARQVAAAVRDAVLTADRRGAP